MVEYQVEMVELAQDLFVGKKIKSVRYSTKEELEEMKWDNDFVVLELEDGTLLYPIRDTEGNGPAILSVQIPATKVGPAEYHFF
jgi:hypothetical protein